MRILFIALYYLHVGGIKYVAKSVIEKLTKAGHKVTYV
jgi:hypothetical protein